MQPPLLLCIVFQKLHLFFPVPRSTPPANKELDPAEAEGAAEVFRVQDSERGLEGFLGSRFTRARQASTHRDYRV